MATQRRSHYRNIRSKSGGVKKRVHVKGGYIKKAKKRR